MPHILQLLLAAFWLGFYNTSVAEITKRNEVRIPIGNQNYVAIVRAEDTSTISVRPLLEAYGEYDVIRVRLASQKIVLLYHRPDLDGTPTQDRLDVAQLMLAVWRDYGRQDTARINSIEFRLSTDSQFQSSMEQARRFGSWEIAHSSFFSVGPYENEIVWYSILGGTWGQAATNVGSLTRKVPVGAIMYHRENQPIADMNGWSCDIQLMARTET